jgi:hypothetical protein
MADDNNRLPTHSADYDEGVRDGRLSTLERRADGHDARDDNHERRLNYLEKIVAGFVAIVFLSTIWPRLEVMVNALSR